MRVSYHDSFEGIFLEPHFQKRRVTGRFLLAINRAFNRP